MEDFLAVQSILTDPKRVTTRPGKAKYLLSMIARCAVCGGVLTITTRAKDTGEYQCNAGHIRCAKDDLDEIAETAILDYLTRPDVHDALTAGEDQDSDELADVRDQLATARHELAALRTEVGAGRLSVASLVAAEPGVLDRISDLEAAEADLVTPSALRGLITPGADVAERWAETPISARREVARLLLTPDVLGELRVDRRPPGRRGPQHCPVAERVVWHRTDQGVETAATPDA